MFWWKAHFEKRKVCFIVEEVFFGEARCIFFNNTDFRG